VVRRHDTVSFLSDLGTDDEGAGVVRAVIRDLAPHVHVVDLTHGIAPFDIRAGAMALVRSIAYVPEGVVLAVVDPGAGTSRRAIAVEVADGAGVIVGPDNGLLAPAIALAGGAGRAVILDNPEFHLSGPGATFAARDIFGPAAAHLCNGVDLTDLGSAVDPAVLLPSVIPLPRREGDALVAEVLWVDRFGNVELNVGPEELAEAWGPEWTRAGEARITIRLADERRSATVVAAFGDLPTGALGLVLDSLGMYAVTMHEASAARELRLGPNDMVYLEPLGVEPAVPPAPPTPLTLGPTRSRQ
jgi:S-adenosylmethionine hydrolase